MIVQYLVQMKLANSGRATNAQEGIVFIEQFIFPTLELCNKLQTERKILAGGPVSGAGLVVSAESSQQLDDIITSLPVWPKMETE
jgi:hypothetical protein